MTSQHFYLTTVFPFLSVVLAVLFFLSFLVYHFISALVHQVEHFLPVRDAESWPPQLQPGDLNTLYQISKHHHQIFIYSAWVLRRASSWGPSLSSKRSPSGLYTNPGFCPPLVGNPVPFPPGHYVEGMRLLRKWAQGNFVQEKHVSWVTEQRDWIQQSVWAWL